MQIEGRVAVVSGGGSGIGRATVLALAQRGARVVVLDLDAAGSEETVALAAAAGGTARFRRCDVTQTAELERAFESVLRELGRLDIAYNNAGIGDEDLFNDAVGRWKRLVEVNLIALIDATRIEVRAMRAIGAGVIVNTASLIGLEPVGFAPVYSASKAGVVAFTRALGYLKAEAQIRVNAVCPEIVATPMTLGSGDASVAELVRRGEILLPEDIAAAVLDLVEDEQRFGAIMKITVQGGRELVAP